MAESDSSDVLELEFEEEDVSEEEEREGEHALGVMPYLFEPVADNPDTEMTVEVEGDGDNSQDVNRLEETSCLVHHAMNPVSCATYVKLNGLPPITRLSTRIILVPYI